MDLRGLFVDERAQMGWVSVIKKALTLGCGALMWLAASAHAQLQGPTTVSQASYVPPMAAEPLNKIVQEQLYPQLEFLFAKLVREKRATTLDGIEAFKANDKFLPGKIAAGLGHVLLNLPSTDPRFPEVLQNYQDIADLTVEDDNHTWGIYYYVLTLYRLRNAGLLESAIRPATLAKLKHRLDWRSFVRTDNMRLINLPTNYYGVAFSIARLRYLLGWEDESGSKALLDKMLSHYQTYSGQYGFSDETDGEGRFDRYSILLIAEICQRYIETGIPVTPELKTLLRRAATIALQLGNGRGEGFSFGRSIGAYGETAVLEILSTAAYLDVLTPEEKEYAYAYSVRVAGRYVDFWYDPAMHSVDLWNKGRRTDTYRGKHRILGENFSLLHQFISINSLWNRAGMADVVPRLDVQEWFDRTQPKYSLTWFAQGAFERALLIYRDGGHVFNLLLVNGGTSQHDNSPYYPLPFAHSIIAGVPDSGPTHAQLLPKFKLADGTVLLPTAYMKDIRVEPDGDRLVLRYRQDALTKQGSTSPVPDSRIQLETAYVFNPGKITRQDTVTPTVPLAVDQIKLEFSSFSDNANLSQFVTTFGRGVVKRYAVQGLSSCIVEDAKGRDAFKSPNGPMQTLITCSHGPFQWNEPLRIEWNIEY